MSSETPSPSPAPLTAADPAPEPALAAPLADAAPATDATPAEPPADAAAAAAAAPAPVDPAAPEAPRIDLEACATELKTRFPGLFGGPHKPIKLRIQVDIQQRAPGVFTRQALSAFLRRYTGSTSYLVALGKSATRFDLDGQPAGDISAEHREAAATELARRRALRREREQAQRQAQAPAAGEGASADGAAPRPPRTDRPPRPPRPPRAPQRGADGPRERAPDRPRDRPQSRAQHRPQDRPHDRQQDRPHDRPQERRPDRPPVHVAPAATAAAPPREPQGPEDAARRERAQLLRAFDSSPLTKANFCALKGLKVEVLDAQLALARQEAAAWAAAHPPARRDPEPERAPERRPDRRPPRRDGAPPRGPR